MNNETKWTPGPWEVTYKAGDFDESVGVSMASHQRNPNHYKTAHLWHSDCEPDCDETVANARLIATAPELYEALDEATKDLVAAQVNARRAAKRDAAWEGVAELIQPSIDRARAALAKARGE